MSKIIQIQHKKIFFDPSPDRQFPHYPVRPSEDAIRMFLADNNPNCPLNKIVVSERNRESMYDLKLMAFSALLRPDHSMRGMNFGIYAGPGQGKTTVVKALLETIGTPQVFIQSDALKSPWHLFEQIRDACAAFGTPLVPQTSQRHFTVPPCNVFFDEAHALSKDLRTGGLLNATEANDGWLQAAPEGKNKPMFKIDCKDVCWIAATTDPGKLIQQSKAFASRFPTTIRWANAGKEEISGIIQGSIAMPKEACDLVAHYARIPRKAKAFAEKMVRERQFSKSTWAEAAAKVAKLSQIDEHGMPYQFIDVLTALGQKPISKNNLCIPAKCEIEELESMVLPSMMDDWDGEGALIGVTSKGCALTRAGLKQLDLRDILHNGDGVLVESL